MIIWLHESNIQKGKDMMTFQAQDGNKIENSIFYKIKVVAAAANYTIRPEDADGEPFSFTNICREKGKTFVLYFQNSLRCQIPACCLTCEYKYRSESG